MPAELSDQIMKPCLISAALQVVDGRIHSPWHSMASSQPFGLGPLDLRRTRPSRIHPKIWLLALPHSSPYQLEPFQLAPLTAITEIHDGYVGSGRGKNSRGGLTIAIERRFPSLENHIPELAIMLARHDDRSALLHVKGVGTMLDCSLDKRDELLVRESGLVRELVERSPFLMG